jgi:hypothetical protein
MIAWPTYNGGLIGRVLRSTTWDSKPGVISDETRSGKRKVRAAHYKLPDEFSVVMHMTLPEYREFMSWWNNTCRKGLYTFAYPKINDNTGILAEYQFDPDSAIKIQNTSGDNLEISMNWMEAV